MGCFLSGYISSTFSCHIPPVDILIVRGLGNITENTDESHEFFFFSL